MLRSFQARCKAVPSVVSEARPLELLQEQSRALLATQGTSALDLRAFTGAERGQDKADLQANQQIDALALKPEEVRRNYTVSGYVFFPKGQYSQVEMLLVDRETGDTQVVREPWH